ncbi:hypothetical protein Mapa_007223 [Marchantia paleacea]|nr:hypothetical protein Mapa_007223 [Marchantia paleacea]
MIIFNNDIIGSELSENFNSCYLSYWKVFGIFGTPLVAKKNSETVCRLCDFSEAPISTKLD